MISLMNGDCLELMKTIPDKSVDMVLTSPPYDNLRSYNGMNDFNFGKFQLIAKELARTLKEGSVIVWVVGDATIGGSETGSSFKQALYFKEECGLNLHDTMIYRKNNVVPLSHSRYEQSFEYMFILSRGKPKTFNGIKDKLNKYSGTKIHGTQYSGDFPVRKSGHNKKTVAAFGLRHNIFTYNNQGDKRREHPAVFPEQLAIDHVFTWSSEREVVMDPFMGSGSTGVACKNLNRNFIGIEKDDKYFEIAQKRINEAKEGLKLAYSINGKQ